MALEIVDLFLRMRARDDRQARIDGVRLLHHLAALEGVGNGNQQAARLGQIGRLDHRRIGGIALERLDAFLPQRRDPILVVLDDEERHALLAQAPS